MMRRLSVSTIAWPDAWDAAFYNILAARNVSLIDIAPTMISKDWEALTPQRLDDFKSFVAGQGFAIAGMQSLFFNLPEARLFGTEQQRQNFIGHLDRLADIANRLGATCLVLGSPPNRNRGELGLAEACTRFADYLHPTLERYRDAGLVLCLEANPEPYGSDFMTDYEQAAALVRQINLPSFRINFDTGCCVLGGGNPAQVIDACAELFGHVHVSEPHLKDLAASNAVPHAEVAEALARNGYQGVACLEMRCGADPEGILVASLHKLIESYRGVAV